MIEISVKGVGLSTSFSLILDSACACVREKIQPRWKPLILTSPPLAEAAAQRPKSRRR